MDRPWDAIVENLGPHLFRYFMARFNHEQSADLTQETLIRVVQKTKAGQFDPARGNLRMYAYGIAHFVALEAQKLPRLDAGGDFDRAGDGDLERDAIERQKSAHLRQALRQLDPVQVQIVSLMIDEELTLAQIGILLNMPEGTVKSQVYRAKERLREILSAKESI